MHIGRFRVMSVMAERTRYTYVSRSFCFVSEMTKDVTERYVGETISQRPGIEKKPYANSQNFRRLL